MKKKQATAAILAALLLAAVLAGCAQTGGAAATPTAAPVLNLNVCVGSEPGTIDPQLNATVDGATLINHAFEGLMRLDADGDIVPAQAAGYTVDDSGTVYTFTLRDDIKWSDGQPVTASDFVYAWRRLMDPTTGAGYSYILEMVKNADEILAGDMTSDQLGIRAPDDKTVEITLSAPCPYFLEICAFPNTYPVRKDVIEKNGDQWTFEDYVCNGPYVLTDWSHNSYMLYSKNPEYYNAEAVGPETIKFYLMDDSAAMLTAYRSGELSFIDQVPAGEIPTLKKDGELTVKGVMGVYFSCLNDASKPFDDPNVRKAFSLAVDRNYLVDSVTAGGEIPASALVPDGLSDVAVGEDFRAVGGAYIDTSAQSYEANCQEARNLLAEAGYPDGEEFPVVEYLYVNDDVSDKIAQALQYMWQDELGVTVTLSARDWSGFMDDVLNGSYQMAGLAWLADFNDPISFLDMWTTGNGNNIARYSNADYDELITRARDSEDRADRIGNMHLAEDALMADMAMIPLYFNTDPYMIDPGLAGFYTSPLGYKYFMYVTEAS